ncbi:MAG: HEAT repeat domain-containing protein [Litorilinea sp.]
MDSGRAMGRQGNASSEFEAWLRAVDAGDDGACEAGVSRLQRDDIRDIVQLYTGARSDSAQNQPDGPLAQGGTDIDRANRRWWAVRACADWAGPGERAILLEMLRDPAVDIRAGAVFCVAQVVKRHWDGARDFAEQLLSALMAALVDEQGLVRQSAADALAQLGKIALPVLWCAMQQNNQSGRTRAAYALRRMKNLDAAHYLYRLLEDSNPMVNLYAREGLDDLGLLDMTYYKP